MTEEIFKNIYQDYGQAIRNYLYYRSGNTELASDLTQETFLTVWKNQYQTGENVKALLYKIAGNLFISQLRRQKVKTEYETDLKFNSREGFEETTVEYRELKLRYESTLNQLPEKQRVVFLMSRKDDLKYKEIADRLQISVKAVEKRMKLALDFMRKSFEQMELRDSGPKN